ncbi:MAG: DinB family protein [Planctomycetaceae bacterium]|nr:DinB family protein [Planctomycetaceae bacterium]
MRYSHIAIPDDAIPTAREPVFQHLLTTYASETNKTVTVWEAVPDALLDFKPHPRVNTIRTILVHQILSERRFFAQFVGLSEPSAESLLPPGEAPATADYVERYVQFAKARLPQLAEATTDWWMTEMPFFGGLRRQRIWTFWRRVLHTCHHRTQVQTWLRMADVPVVPPIYGPSGDIRWSEDDPTYSVEAAGRG